MILFIQPRDAAYLPIRLDNISMETTAWELRLLLQRSFGSLVAPHLQSYSLINDGVIILDGFPLSFYFPKKEEEDLQVKVIHLIHHHGIVQDCKIFLPSIPKFNHSDCCCYVLHNGKPYLAVKKQASQILDIADPAKSQDVSQSNPIKEENPVLPGEEAKQKALQTASAHLWTLVRYLITLFIFSHGGTHEWTPYFLFVMIVALLKQTGFVDPFAPLQGIWVQLSNFVNDHRCTDTKRFARLLVSFFASFHPDLEFSSPPTNTIGKGTTPQI